MSEEGIFSGEAADSNQHGVLLHALTEYTEKLRSISLSLHKQSVRLSFLLFGGSACYALLLAYFAVLVSDNPAFKSVLITAIATGGVMFIIVYQQLLSGRLAKFEILPLQSTLKRLVNRASKLDTHSISDADLKIIFDLRLAEAEASIALSEWVLGRQSNSFFLIAFHRLFGSS